jgi:hypothetical protein
MGAAGRALAECYGWAGVADRYLALSEAIVAARRGTGERNPATVNR